VFDWTTNQAKRLESMERIVNGRGQEGRDDSGRLTTSRVGLAVWLKSPIFGHGLGYGASLRELGNTYVLLLVDAGVLPIPAFIATVVAYRAAMRRVSYTVSGAIAAYVGITCCLAALTSHNFLTERNVNFILGMTLALLSLPGNDRTRRTIS
jgi:hypothetical protein